MTIPFVALDSQNKLIEAEIMNAFKRFFNDKRYILGAELDAFEQKYAAFHGLDHCIGVSNGLDALHLALKALEIGPGDEVIVPANTFIASWLAISYAGATIVPVEPDRFTYNLDPDLLEAAISPKTKAIIPVHLYGQACEMAQIMEVALRHGLYVVEDNAQAQGALSRGKMTGTFGDINATSFYPTKNLGAFGDAGALTTQNGGLAHKVRVLRNYGSEIKYVNEVIGFNSRMDELQAALLSVKLNHLLTWTAERRKIADHYNDLLGDISQVILPGIAEGATHVYHLYVIRVAERDGLQKHLDSCGIGTAIHYPIPPHLQKAYQRLGYQKGDFPIAEELAATSLSLPLFPGMTEGQVEKVARSVKDFYA